MPINSHFLKLIWIGFWHLQPKESWLREQLDSRNNIEEYPMAKCMMTPGNLFSNSTFLILFETKIIPLAPY